MVDVECLALWGFLAKCAEAFLFLDDPELILNGEPHGDEGPDAAITAFLSSDVRTAFVLVFPCSDVALVISFPVFVVLALPFRVVWVGLFKLPVVADTAEAFSESDSVGVAACPFCLGISGDVARKAEPFRGMALGGVTLRGTELF